MEVEEDEEQVWSWGAGTEGQLGTSKNQDELSPSLSSFATFEFLSCGGAHVIATTPGGRVLTWGRGTSGQLGHGETLNCLKPKPVDFLQTSVIINASAGWNHSGFVSDSGHLFTCGDGSFGQLGHGDYESSSSPLMVSYFSSRLVRQIACGMRHSVVLLKGCTRDQAKDIYTPGEEDLVALRMSINPIVRFNLCRSFRLPLAGIMCDGEVYMIGKNNICNSTKASQDKDMLSNSRKSKEELTAYKVPGLDEIKVVQIEAGAEYSALVTEDGSVMTWGWGEHGQLGLGNTDDQIRPQLVSFGDEKEHITACKVYYGSGFTYVVRKLRRSSLTR